jgi:hypothetical protein
VRDAPDARSYSSARSARKCSLDPELCGRIDSPYAECQARVIYRRWSTRLEIIEQAVFPGLTSISVQPTGDLRRDLRRIIRAYLAAFTAPAARAAMPALLDSYQSAENAGSPERWLCPRGRSSSTCSRRAR